MEPCELRRPSIKIRKVLVNNTKATRTQQLEVQKKAKDGEKQWQRHGKLLKGDLFFGADFFRQGNFREHLPALPIQQKHRHEKE